jgi:hypothetical protein
MPIAPSQQSKIIRQPVPGFKAKSKKVWDPPDRSTFTVEDLGRELSVISSNLLVVGTTLAKPVDCDDPRESERVKKASQEVLDLARRLESTYNRLMSHGIMAHQPIDNVTVYRADDIPW